MEFDELLDIFDRIDVDGTYPQQLTEQCRDLLDPVEYDDLPPEQELYI